MADIASALNNMAKAIFGITMYRKVESIEPFLLTPAVTISSITKNVSIAGLKASYVTLKVRSMGTATYIGIGRTGSQSDRLTAAGDVYEISAPDKAFFNTNEIMCKADVADAVIEVSGMHIPSKSISDDDKQRYVD